MKRALVLALVSTVSLPALCRTETIVTTCDGTMCSWQRPVVAAPKGWVRDEAAGQELQIEALVPAGAEFQTAPAVMYARAAYKPWNPGTLAHFIAGEHDQFRRRFPGATVRRTTPLTDADGKTLAVYEYAAPKGRHHLELVAFADEGDYFLVFGLRAKSAQMLRRARAAFRALVGAYRKGQAHSPPNM